MKPIQTIAVRTVLLPPFLFLFLFAADLRAGEIHDAAAAGDLNKVRTLLSANPALLESKDGDGNTPLISACWGPPANIPQVAVANFLIEKGANVNEKNKNGGSPVYFAHRDFYLMQGLIAKGASINIRAYGGLTPLHQAAATGNLKVAKLLIDHGADLNARGTHGTIVQTIINRQTNSSGEMVKLLLKSGAKFQPFSYGNSELHVAALRGSTDMARLLVECGADANAVNEYGHTPLYYAAKHGHRKTADALIAAGARESGIVEANYGKAPQLASALGEGEAHLWCLGGTAPGTGYAVKTKGHLIIFDPAAIDDSSEAGLANGCLNPNELAGQKITVLITRMMSGYEPRVSELAKRMPGADFVLSYNPTTTDNADRSELPPYRLAAPNESFSMGDIKVHTIPAIKVPAMYRIFAGGEGLGYLVEVDGLKIFHSGLHAARNEASEIDKYRKEIDFLTPFGPIDIAILPIKGRHLRIAYEPYLYLIEQLSPKAIYLIGDDLATEEHKKCTEVLRACKIPVAYPEGGIAKGERFHYLQEQPHGKQRTTNPDGTAPASASLRLDFGTFLGGKGEDRAHGMAVDAQGNIYLTAPIRSTDFPTTPDALNKTPTGIYVSKLSPAGILLYSTFLGARGGNNYAHGIARDKDGCIYLAGNTTNPDFPTTPGAFQTTLRGPSDNRAAHGDGFVVKLSPTGDRIIYSTFLGGSGPDICGKIAVDAEGNAYVLGCTSSKDFPVTAGAYQTALKSVEDKPTGRGDLFVAKLSADGSKLVYCTYVGGSGMDLYGENLFLDSSGCVTFAGASTSPDFPVTANASDRSYHGGSSGPRGGGDAIVVKLNSTGTALVYASYIGGSGDDSARSVAVDNEGNIWIAGDTTSSDFPTTPAAWCRQNKGAADCFILKLSPLGGPLHYSSFLGGSKADQYGAVAVHPSGLLVLTGRTESADFPVTPNASSPILKGSADLFVALLDPAAKSLRYSTHLGGSGNEVPGPLLLIKDSVYLAGNTTSADFPVTPDAGDTTYNGGTNEWGGDAFITRFTLAAINRSPVPPLPRHLRIP